MVDRRRARTPEAPAGEWAMSPTPTTRDQKLTPAGFDSSVRHTSGMVVAMMSRSGTNQSFTPGPATSTIRSAGTRPRSSRGLYFRQIAEAEAAGDGPGRPPPQHYQSSGRKNHYSARLSAARWSFRASSMAGTASSFSSALSVSAACRRRPRSTSTTPFPPSPTAATFARNSCAWTRHVIRFTTRSPCGPIRQPRQLHSERHSRTYCRRGPQRLASTSNPAPGDVSSTKHRSSLSPPRQALSLSARKAGGSNHLLICCTRRLKLHADDHHHRAVSPE